MSGGRKNQHGLGRLDADDESPRHIRDERGSREHMGLVGKELPLAGGLGWCGEWIEGEWMFVGTDHALLHLAYNGGMTPCQDCLKRLREIIDAELNDEPLAGHPTIPKRPYRG